MRSSDTSLSFLLLFSVLIKEKGEYDWLVPLGYTVFPQMEPLFRFALMCTCPCIIQSWFRWRSCSVMYKFKLPEWFKSLKGL